MLTALRSKSGGIIAKVFIGLLAASFAVWGIEDMLRGSTSDTLATVGDRTIGTYEFSNNFNQQLASYSRRLGQTITPDRARELGLDRQVLADLMRDASLDSQANELGIIMPERAVAQTLADNPQFQSSDGKFSADNFRRLLQQNGLSEQQFFATERLNMTRQVITQPLTTQAVVPDTLVELVWKHRTEERDATWFEFTINTSGTQPSDADLKSLYDQSPERFRRPERRSLLVVALTPEAIASSIEVKDEDIQRQFEVRKNELLAKQTRTVLQLSFANEAEAQAAADKIKAGTAFEDIAKEQGKSLADISLGTVTKSAIPDAAVAEAAFALKEGEVSAPVKGRFGHVVLKATDTQSAAEITLDSLRDELVAAVRTSRARDQILDLHDKFEDARAGGASLEEAAREIAITPVSIGPVALDGSNEQGETIAVPGHSDTLKTAFETDIGLEISPLTDGDNGFTWVETREIKPSFVPAFNDVKGEVATAWTAREAAQATRKKAEELVAKLKSGTSITELAASENAELKTATGLKRNESGSEFSPADLSELFSVPDNGKTFSLSSDGKTAKIMASTPVLGTSFDPASTEAQAIREVLADNLSNDLF
ncbi:MAG: SurA N-terminal domain-containing protein, partial [Anderseniella sp.]